MKVRLVVAYTLVMFVCHGEGYDASNVPRVLAFEARHGEYVSHGAGYGLSVTSNSAVISLRGHAVRMSVAGARSKPALEGLDRMGRANYFAGDGGREVRTSYDLYGRVRWPGIYPGIDVVFHGNSQHLEYDFEIAAGGDPGEILLEFEGVDSVLIDAHGDLVLRAGSETIHQPKPAAYQIIAGKQRAVETSYWADASHHIRFRTFDNSFGGSAQSSAAGLARDTQGNLYVTGETDSTDFATVNPAQGHLGTAPLLVTANGGQNWTYPSLGPANSVSDSGRSLLAAQQPSPWMRVPRPRFTLRPHWGCSSARMADRPGRPRRTI
jgi:hypothetical protein